jgi:hypothetical protein
VIDNLESNYDCANAGLDLHNLLEELSMLRAQDTRSKEWEQHINRIENQISFIENKCSIPH